MRTHRVAASRGRNVRNARPTGPPPTPGRSTARIIGALLMLWGTLIAIAIPADAAVFGAVGATFPTPRTVGETNVPAFFDITNNATAPNVGPVIVTDIELVPSCANQFARCPFGGQDPGVFSLSATGIGEVGTAFAGRVFNITQIGPDTFQFTPADGMPLILATPGTPGAAGRIDYTINVLKAPTLDANPGSPGLQTNQVAVATLTSTVGPLVVATDIPGTGQITVNLATPLIGTTPSAPTPIGSPISDSATLTGLVAPLPPGPNSGTITFNLYGPGDNNCAGAVIFTSTVPATANNTPFSSGPFTPTTMGTYQFRAVYSGDANNNPATSGCGAEPVVVQPANPTISTAASEKPVPFGNQFQISDSATLASTFNPTGTITFKVFGPGDAACMTPLLPALAPVVVNAGNGPYPSGPFTIPATTPGVYRFIATYSGDVNNVGPVSTACQDPGESVLLPATPTIATTVVNANVPVGTTIQDTAVVSNGLAPIGGTVTFQVFGPGDAACATPLATETVPVGAGPGGPTTASAATVTGFPATTVGTYQFRAKYNGDGLNNNPSAASPCGAEPVTVTKVAPALTTTASATVPVGGTISDVAHLMGGFSPTGTITFTVYGPTNPAAPVCTTPTVFPANPPNPANPTVPPIVVNGNGDYPSPAFTVTQAGTYVFVASYSGDANNTAPPATPCNDPAEAVVVTKAAPALTTTASASVPVGGTISDVAHLTGGVGPTGTITFTVFGPTNPAAPVCTTPTVFPPNPPNPANPTVPPIVVNGNGDYPSPAFTVTQAGTYVFVATYSGDANNTAPPATTCNDPAEAVVVTQATPTLTTAASMPAVAGGQIHDTASLLGGSNPTGTITFTLYGPTDPAAPVCVTPTVLQPPNPANPFTLTVNGANNYDSPMFTVTQAGTYVFVASYSGDANNKPIPPTSCGDPAEAVVVKKQTTDLRTNASPPVPVGQPIFDTATLAGGTLPTGTITFTVFGPFDPLDPNPSLCTTPTNFGPGNNPVTVSVNGNGSYISPSFTPSVAGRYRFVVSYSGDANNVAAGPTACNDPAEAVVVSKFPTGLTTTASPSPSVPLGGAIHDTANLTGPGSPTGTITFNLFGPDNATCTGAPAFTKAVTVAGAGAYQSGDFTPTLPGIYRYQAIYSGDLNNAGFGPTACTDPLEQVLVTAKPILTTTASPAVPEGGTVNDTATISGLIAPATGTITFTLFGPDNATCTGVPIFTATVPVAGNGTYQSGSFLTQVDGPAGPGTYRFIATYSGDASNQPTGPTLCADPAEAVVVTPLTPQIHIVKTATPTTKLEPGGTFMFNLVITNPGPKQVTITDLFDDVYGSLATLGTCNTAIGTVLAPGGSYTCSFPGDFTGLAPDAQTDTATVIGVDKQGTPVTDNDQATVTLTPVPPSIAVVKTASPPSLPEPGGTFTFNVVVTNTSIKPLTLTALNDNVYGDLNGKGTCATGAILAPSGGTYSCAFPGVFNGTGGQQQTDTVTATGIDRTGNLVSAMDDAIVAITSLTPSITVEKSVIPSSLPEPGGTFTFTATVNNTSTEVLTLTSFVDNIYGNLNGKGTCSVPQTLAVGGSYTCTFPGDFNGFAPDAQTDTVTGTAVDTQGRQVTATAQAIVTLTLVPPTIAVVKTADPLTKVEPGGNFTFTVATTNTSFKQVTITSLVDNVYGDLNGQGTCAIGAILAPGATYTCSFVGPFTGLAPAAQTDTVTSKAKDNRGNEATATAQATVSLTPRPPTIAVIKTPNPTERPAPGGPFDFTVSVKNTTFEPLTLTVLNDNIYGDLNGKGTCATGGTIAPGATYTCTFTGNFTGNAGDAQTDTVTSTGVNSRGQSATATANATVTLTPAPSIVVTKVADPTSRSAPGGPFTFTVGVKNTTTEPLTVTGLTDDVYGDLNGRGSCAIGTRIAPGGTYTCSFVGNFTGNAGDAQTDTVTGTAVNDRGQSVMAKAKATVNLTPVPSIVVTKVADPTTRPEPGGTFNFTVGVKNTTTEPLTLTKLTDDVYGDLNGKGTCSVPQTLAVGATYTCKFPGPFSGKGSDAQTDTVTATAVNSRGEQATAQAKATVNLTPVTVPPTVPPTTPPPTNPPPTNPPPVIQPPVIQPPTFVPPPVVKTPLARTGFGLGGSLRLAVALMLAGFLLILGTWRRAAWLPAKAVPEGVAGKMMAVRRSRAERTAARASARLRRSRGPDPKWQGARSSRFSRGSNRPGRSRRRGL